MLISNMIYLVVSLRRVAPNTSEQRSRSGLCKRVIRREANETEGLVYIYIRINYLPFFLKTHYMLHFMQIRVLYNMVANYKL